MNKLLLEEISKITDNSDKANSLQDRLSPPSNHTERILNQKKLGLYKQIREQGNEAIILGKKKQSKLKILAKLEIALAVINNTGTKLSALGQIEAAILQSKIVLATNEIAKLELAMLEGTELLNNTEARIEALENSQVDKDALIKEAIKLFELPQTSTVKEVSVALSRIIEQAKPYNRLRSLLYSQFYWEKEEDRVAVLLEQLKATESLIKSLSKELPESTITNIDSFRRQVTEFEKAVKKWDSLAEIIRPQVVSTRTKSKLQETEILIANAIRELKLQNLRFWQYKCETTYVSTRRKKIDVST